MKTLSDKEMLEIAKKVEKLLKNKKVYIHCLGGHGRTGVLAGIILHKVYPHMTYKQIIQELHDKHQTRKYKPNKSTPQTSSQFNQLHRIITGRDDIFFYNDTDKNYVFSNLYYRPKRIKNPNHYLQLMEKIGIVQSLITRLRNSLVAQKIKNMLIL
jgi:hypothetical protein